MKRISRILLLLLLLYPLFSWADDRYHNPRHGNKQVEMMLLDRPAMKGFFVGDGSLRKMSMEDSVWQWTAKEYGKKVLGSVIEWNNGKVLKPIHYLAEHAIPYKGSKGLIRIRQVFRDSQGKLRDATFEELWSACIFELINLENDESFVSIYNQAIQGTITREEWVRVNTRLEHKAILKRKAFFRDIWKSWAEKNGFSYEERHWRLNEPDDYQEWIALYQKSKENPYTYWEDYYDKQIVPYLNKVKQYEQQKKEYETKTREYERQKREYDIKLQEYQRQMKRYKQRTSGQN